MSILHSNKVKDERDAFVEELYKNLTNKDSITSGDLEARSRRLHKIILPLYIMKHYSKNKFISPYFNFIMTNVIEAEMLLMLGFKNAAMTSLRAAMESSFKFLYYEYHPIENLLHNESEFDLTGMSYREFLYSFPNLKNISFNSRDRIERIWSDLCKYVHSDINSVQAISYVSEISSALNLEEKEFNALLNNLRDIFKVIISIFFAIDKTWAQDIEKTYFDAIFEVYDFEERSEVKEKLQVH
ncbi:hypothetical protein P4483_27135 [Bacillus thuringiensis]|nr:hypothetical protein [Bacillus thuringiensis]